METEGKPRKLGIAAGSGPLPAMLAEAALAAGRDVYVIGIEGAAEKEIERFPHAWVRLGAMGEFLRLLKENRCEDIVLIGGIKRPNLASLFPDKTGRSLMPRVARWLMQGDDGLLRGLADYFEKEHGFRVIGAHEVAGGLLAPEGVLSKAAPSPEQEIDIDVAARAALAIGALDIGQGAVACRGVVLALEAAEGTDRMLERVSSLPQDVRGREEARAGVLVKLSKPGQEKRVDLPTVGVKTVENVAAAGLAGIAVEAGGALIVDGEAVARAANRAGIFVVGLAPDRLRKLRS
ncbi:MAG: UDP-2,3-diacylglucosamine diphosphatase LpxI [Parvibaculum sp.]|nr:UDP-2,3-diacylglucosamine diphosphatase LpxI [Parvibaculum sp.]